MLAVEEKIKSDGVVGPLTEIHFAMAFSTSLEQSEILALARKTLDLLLRPIPSATGQVWPTVSMTVFIDDQTVHDPQDIFGLCLSVQAYKHITLPEITVLTKERIDQASKLASGAARIAEAIKDARLDLTFQPFVNTEDGELEGFETLVRWNEPEIGKFSALEILELSDSEGTIEDLDYMVLEKACRTAVERSANADDQAIIAVNCDSRTFHSSRFTRNVKQILRRTGFDPSRLEIEMTEHSVLLDVSGITDKIESLRKIGVHFSLDDFGTGYSSLSHLQQLPISKIKIDQSFVRDLKSKRSSTLIQSIVSSARLLGMKTTAEGTEKKEHVIAMRVLGCDYLQGYGISRPLSAKKFLSFSTQDLPDIAAWTELAN